MKPVVPAALVAALVAPILVPDAASAQLLSSAVPVIHCSELPSYIKTAPPKATVQITGTCTNMELVLRTEPITIIAGTTRAPSATIVGLRLRSIRNLQWHGGVIEGIAGLEPTTNWQHERGLSVDNSADLSFSGVRFRNAMRGATFTRSSNIRVVNSVFTRMRSDGINLADVTGAVISGNTFSDFSPIPKTCTYPDGRVVLHIGRGTCELGGGTWKDGDHPDCLQMWNSDVNRPLRDILIARNVLTTPGVNNCQGLTMHGTRSAELVRFLDNIVRTDSTNGISVTNCSDCEVRGNRVEGIESFGLPYIMVRKEFPNPGLIACNNTVVTNHYLKGFGTAPCS